MNFSIIYPKDIEQLRREKGALLIDIRSEEDYKKGHWKDAINFSEEEITDYTKVLNKRRCLILYCQHGGSSMQLARTLGKIGYSTGTVIGGYEAMKKFQESYFKNMLFVSQ
jgi:thiosulfate sulfurtransferase